MSSTELQVSQYDSSRKIMFLIKELLLKNNKIVVKASRKSTDNAAKACQALVRFGYVEYSDIKTETNVEKDRRIILILITLTKTKDFDRLYKENEELRKKRAEERKKEETPKNEETPKKEE